MVKVLLVASFVLGYIVLDPELFAVRMTFKIAVTLIGRLLG